MEAGRKGNKEARERYRGVLGRSWRASWEVLGGSWGGLGEVLGALGEDLGGLGEVLKGSWGLLKTDGFMV